MSNKTILDTVLIVRHGGITGWEKTSYKLQKGELGIAYLDNGNVIVKAGIDGTVAWKDCPQVEGTFEKDLILTYNFGRDALYAKRDPEITYPTVKFTANFSPLTGEAGSYVNKIVWSGTYTDGVYEFGSTDNKEMNSLANTTASWIIKDKNGYQIGTSENNTEGWDYQAQLTDSVESYPLQVSVLCNAAKEDTYIPYNNVGEIVPEKKIKGFDESGENIKDFTVNAHATGYRKPFWAVLSTPLNLSEITSNQVRSLSSSAVKTKGLPCSLNVPQGSRQVVFFAKAGIYNKLVARDINAMGAEIYFDKTPRAVKVEGANGYLAVDYDMWSVTWDGPIGSPKSLLLAWT